MTSIYRGSSSRPFKGHLLRVASPARRSQSSANVTLFDSTGLAIQDLAIALAAMERADEIDGVQTIDLSDIK